MNESFKYPGDELVLFQHATHWKKYFSCQIKPYIKGSVLEAGAGIGATTLLLNDGSARQWLMLEPDEGMSEVLRRKIEGEIFLPNCFVQTGTIDNITSAFDTIIYIDVLEHIEADAAEMQKATALLNPGGHIIILSPAFQYLFSPFDKVIGHYRRYNRKQLQNIIPADLHLIRNRYYDTAGYFAALMNKLLLHQKYPTPKQISFWDKCLVPISRVTDKLFFHSFGKSIIGIWQKKN